MCKHFSLLTPIKIHTFLFQRHTYDKHEIPGILPDGDQTYALDFMCILIPRCKPVVGTVRFVWIAMQYPVETRSSSQCEKNRLEKRKQDEMQA